MSKKILFLRSVGAGDFAGAAQKRQVMLTAWWPSSADRRSSGRRWTNMRARLVEQRRQQGYTSDRDPHDEALEQLLMQFAVQSGAHRFGGCQLFGHRAAGGSPFAGAHRRCGFYRRARNQTAYADLQRARNAASALRGAGIRPGYAEFRSRENQGDSRRGGALLQEDRSGQSADYPRTVRLCPDHPFPASIKEAKQRTKERLLDMRERIIKGRPVSTSWPACIRWTVRPSVAAN